MLNLLQITISSGQNALSPEMINGAILGGVKLVFILALLVYFFFSIIVVRQVHIMKNTLITPFSPIVLMLGYGHMMAVIFIGFLFLTIL